MSRSWVDALRTALEAEFGKQARIAALATVDSSHRPHVRSVVCRHLHDDGSLWVTSDRRTDKNEQARAQPFGEIAFWLPSRREQFRLSGPLAVLSTGDLRSQAWLALSDTARALFFWDEPGAPKLGDDLEAPGLVSSSVPIPDSFELLVLQPDLAEFLDLKTHPHRRLRWRVENRWTGEEINP